MHKKIFRAYVYSSILSIYYANIANITTYHDTYIAPVLNCLGMEQPKGLVHIGTLITIEHLYKYTYM